MKTLLLLLALGSVAWGQTMSPLADRSKMKCPSGYVKPAIEGEPAYCLDTRKAQPSPKWDEESLARWPQAYCDSEMTIKRDAGGNCVYPGPAKPSPKPEPVDVPAHRGCHAGYEYDGAKDVCILRDKDYEILPVTVIHVCPDKRRIKLQSEDGKWHCILSKPEPMNIWSCPGSGCAPVNPEAPGSAIKAAVEPLVVTPSRISKKCLLQLSWVNSLTKDSKSYCLNITGKDGHILPWSEHDVEVITCVLGTTPCQLKTSNAPLDSGMRQMPEQAWGQAKPHYDNVKRVCLMITIHDSNEKLNGDYFTCDVIKDGKKTKALVPIQAPDESCTVTGSRYLRCVHGDPEPSKQPQAKDK